MCRRIILHPLLLFHQLGTVPSWSRQVFPHQHWPMSLWPPHLCLRWNGRQHDQDLRVGRWETLWTVPGSEEPVSKHKCSVVTVRLQNTWKHTLQYSDNERVLSECCCRLQEQQPEDSAGHRRLELWYCEVSDDTRINILTKRILWHLQELRSDCLLDLLQVHSHGFLPCQSSDLHHQRDHIPASVWVWWSGYWLGVPRISWLPSSG